MHFINCSAILEIPSLTFSSLERNPISSYISSLILSFEITGSPKYSDKKAAIVLFPAAGIPVTKMQYMIRPPILSVPWEPGVLLRQSSFQQQMIPLYQMPRDRMDIPVRNLQNIITLPNIPHIPLNHILPLLGNMNCIRLCTH